MTVLCNNNEIYGLTGGQTGPTTPTGTKTLSSPGGNPNTPINLQGLVRSSPHALYAKTTVYHQLHMRNAIREAIEQPGFGFVDITSQCIENNGRRIGFASANDMLTFYRKTYKRAAKDAEHLNPFEIGVLYPRPMARGTNGNSAGMTVVPERPAELPAQPAGPMKATAESPAATAAPAAAGDDEKGRKRAESQERAAVMAQLRRVKLRVAKKELTLVDALTEAGSRRARVAADRCQRPGSRAGGPGRGRDQRDGADPQTQDSRPSLTQARRSRRSVARAAPAAPPHTTRALRPADPKEAKRARRSASWR